ncbi:MAG: polysaccharide deacetylase family protein, partial [Acidobacteriaceae bacterium]|nr:polysaccharide deacetylase family protein [Acidobacteriaceae bacterium]
MEIKRVPIANVLGLKAQLSHVLYRAKVFEYLYLGSSDSLIVFNYHRIREHEQESTLFHDEVFGPTITQFTEQINWLRRHTRIINEAELLDMLASGRPVANRCSMITFDDGYRDNFTLAFPVLERYEVAATFTIPSEIITSRRLGWWDMISYFVKKSSKKTIELDGAVYSVSASRQAVTNAIISRMAREPYPFTLGLLDRLSVACEVDFPSREVQAAQLMTWDEVRCVSRSVISIGSQTHTHPVLATMDRGDQMQELATSKRVLEQEIGKPVSSIAYPVGGRMHFTSETKEVARLCGYSVG